MDHHAGRLINNDQSVVFVDDVKGNVLGQNSAVEARAIELQRCNIAGLHPIAFFYGLPIDVDEACVGCGLDTSARSVGQMFHEELVHTQGFLPAIGYNAQVLVKFVRAIVHVGLARHGTKLFFNRFFNKNFRIVKNNVVGAERVELALGNGVSDVFGNFLGARLSVELLYKLAIANNQGNDASR